MAVVTLKPGASLFALISQEHFELEVSVVTGILTLAAALFSKVKT